MTNGFREWYSKLSSEARISIGCSGCLIFLIVGFLGSATLNRMAANRKPTDPPEPTRPGANIILVTWTPTATFTPPPFTLTPSPTSTVTPTPTPTIPAIAEAEKAGIGVFVVSAKRQDRVGFLNPGSGKTYLVLEV